jgi:hypothetical protein
MAQCAVCNQDLEAGYAFCHFCGTPADSASGGEAPRKQDLVDLVEKVKDLSSRSREVAHGVRRTVDTLLGSPVSIQRQILYALLAGFAFASMDVAWHGFRRWLISWLTASILLLWPISYWTTGVVPLAGVVNAVLGGELSFRRRLVFALILAVLMSDLVSLVGEKEPASQDPLTSAMPPVEVSRAAIRIGDIEFTPLAFAGSFLFGFYLMGFAASWRPVLRLESSISRDGMAERAATIADQVRAAIEKRRIPGLETSRVKMAKLRHYTAGASSGTAGEQLSFIRGRARIVVFIQDFGDGLFIRWTSFYDASGRRLWLLIGFLVAAIDRLTVRWIGSSLLEYSYQVSQTLSPATRNQVLLRPTRGGIFSRALRLVEGVSEYSWNEIYALAGAVQESLIVVLQGAVGSHEEAERIRVQIERQADHERRLQTHGAGPAGDRR